MTEINSDALKELTRLATALVEADAAVNAAEEELKEAKAKARKLREEDIPDYMQELGITKLQLESGETVSYKDDVRLEWNDAQKALAFTWMEKNEFDGLIKTTVGVEFGKGELEHAKALLKELADRGVNVALKRDVHWQTMCAFLREQIEEGKPVPMEEWGAVAIKKATVAKPRTRRI